MSRKIQKKFEAEMKMQKKENRTLVILLAYVVTIPFFFVFLFYYFSQSTEATPQVNSEPEVITELPPVFQSIMTLNGKKIRDRNDAPCLVVVYKDRYLYVKEKDMEGITKAITKILKELYGPDSGNYEVREWERKDFLIYTAIVECVYQDWARVSFEIEGADPDIGFFHKRKDKWIWVTGGTWFEGDEEYEKIPMEVK